MEKEPEPAGWRAVGGLFPLVCLRDTFVFILSFTYHLFNIGESFHPGTRG